MKSEELKVKGRTKNPMTKNKIPTTRLIIAASEQDANLYWATKFLAPDPVIFIEHRKKRFLILNDLEVDRGKKEAEVDHVIRYGEILNTAKKQGKKLSSTADVVSFFLKSKSITHVAVPQSFPLGEATALKRKKISVTALPDPFYPGRLIKTSAESTAIKKSLKATSHAIQCAYQVLKDSKIKGNRIYWQGGVLTSERLRAVINIKLMEQNCLGKHTIVAGGEQAVDPHCEGSGPLIPHRPIIMDVFPKSMTTQYFADMTRTVIKGQATDINKKQWHAVKRAQETGIKMVKAGVDGLKIHTWIENYFKSLGFLTERKNGRMQGFFHGTGHGLGLDIHEAPRVSRASNRLQAGNVITVEPGLYYPDIGGVRLEDVVQVTKTGCDVLSKCPKMLQIP